MLQWILWIQWNLLHLEKTLIYVKEIRIDKVFPSHFPPNHRQCWWGTLETDEIDTHCQ